MGYLTGWQEAEEFLNNLRSDSLRAKLKHGIGKCPLGQHLVIMKDGTSYCRHNPDSEPDTGFKLSPKAKLGIATALVGGTALAIGATVLNKKKPTFEPTPSPVTEKVKEVKTPPPQEPDVEKENETPVTTNAQEVSSPPPKKPRAKKKTPATNVVDEQVTEPPQPPQQKRGRGRPKKEKPPVDPNKPPVKKGRPPLNKKPSATISPDGSTEKQSKTKVSDRSVEPVTNKEPVNPTPAPSKLLATLVPKLKEIDASISDKDATKVIQSELKTIKSESDKFNKLKIEADKKIRDFGDKPTPTQKFSLQLDLDAMARLENTEKFIPFKDKLIPTGLNLIGKPLPTPTSTPTAISPPVPSVTTPEKPSLVTTPPKPDMTTTATPIETESDPTPPSPPVISTVIAPDKTNKKTIKTTEPDKDELDRIAGHFVIYAEDADQFINDFINFKHQDHPQLEQKALDIMMGDVTSANKLVSHAFDGNVFAQRILKDGSFDLDYLSSKKSSLYSYISSEKIQKANQQDYFDFVYKDKINDEISPQVQKEIDNGSLSSFDEAPRRDLLLQEALNPELLKLQSIQDRINTATSLISQIDSLLPLTPPTQDNIDFYSNQIVSISDHIENYTGSTFEYESIIDEYPFVENKTGKTTGIHHKTRTSIANDIHKLASLDHLPSFNEFDSSGLDPDSEEYYTQKDAFDRANDPLYREWITTKEKWEDKLYNSPSIDNRDADWVLNQIDNTYDLMSAKSLLLAKKQSLTPTSSTTIVTPTAIAPETSLNQPTEVKPRKIYQPDELKSLSGQQKQEIFSDIRDQVSTQIAQHPNYPSLEKVVNNKMASLYGGKNSDEFKSHLSQYYSTPINYLEYLPVDAKSSHAKNVLLLQSQIRSDLGLPKLVIPGSYYRQNGLDWDSIYLSRQYSTTPPSVTPIAITPDSSIPKETEEIDLGSTDSFELPNGQINKSLYRIKKTGSFDKGYEYALEEKTLRSNDGITFEDADWIPFSYGESPQQALTSFLSGHTRNFDLVQNNSILVQEAKQNASSIISSKLQAQSDLHRSQQLKSAQKSLLSSTEVLDVFSSIDQSQLDAKQKQNLKARIKETTQKIEEAQSLIASLSSPQNPPSPPVPSASIPDKPTSSPLPVNPAISFPPLDPVKLSEELTTLKSTPDGLFLGSVSTVKDRITEYRVRLSKPNEATKPYILEFRHINNDRPYPWSPLNFNDTPDAAIASYMALNPNHNLGAIAEKTQLHLKAEQSQERMRRELENKKIEEDRQESISLLTSAESEKAEVQGKLEGELTPSKRKILKKKLRLLDESISGYRTLLGYNLDPASDNDANAPSSPPNTTPILSRHSLKFYPVQDYRQNPSPEVERTFVEFGAKVRFDRIETGLIIDPDTEEIVNEAKGESNSVTHDIEDLDQAKRYIQFHNHPSLANEVNKPLTMERIEKGDYPVGFLGHGFSPNDVLVAIRDNLLSTRLTTLAYDYHLDLPEVAAIPSSLGKHFSQKRYSFKNEKERMLFYSEMKKFLKLQKQLTMDRLNANKDPAYKRMIFARRKDTPDRVSFVCDFPHEMLYPIFKQLGWNYRKMRNHTPDEEVKRQLFIQFGAEAKQDSLPTTSSIDIDTIDPLDRNFLVVDDRDLVVSIELAPEEISELD